MKLHCHHCGVKGSADDSYSGKKVKCPKCGEFFVVSPEMAIDSPDAFEEIEQEKIEQEEIVSGTVEESVGQQEVAVEDSLFVPEETESVEESKEDIASLDDEVEQEPRSFRKKQCWQCGKMEGENESLITNNGGLYCTNCIQPEDPDVASASGGEAVESVDKPGTHGEAKPVKKGAWAKLKGIFRK